MAIRRNFVNCNSLVNCNKRWVDLFRNLLQYPSFVVASPKCCLVIVLSLQKKLHKGNRVNISPYISPQVASYGGWCAAGLHDTCTLILRKVNVINCSWNRYWEHCVFLLLLQWQAYWFISLSCLICYRKTNKLYHWTSVIACYWNSGDEFNPLSGQHNKTTKTCYSTLYAKKHMCRFPGESLHTLS